MKDDPKYNRNSKFSKLNIACVFSPPAEGNKDVQQLQEDLPQELEDNKKNPEEKKAELKQIIDKMEIVKKANNYIQIDMYSLSDIFVE